MIRLLVLFLCLSGAARAQTYGIVPLDASTVVTGGTAITALKNGHAIHGGTLITGNTAGMCVDQTQTAGTVTGTPSTTVCVPAATPFYLVPNNHSVSVNSTASSVAIAGWGQN